MSRMRVVECGPAVTVQDLGRTGTNRFGLAASGALDARALRTANHIVGNDPAAAALEFAFTAGRFEFTAPAVVAVSGAACRITVGDRMLPTNYGIPIDEGETVSVGPITEGVYGYLAVAGGIDVAEVFGARATHSRFRIGGHEGRTLAAGDALAIGTASAARPGLGLAPQVMDWSAPIGIVDGPQADFFSAEAWQALENETFSATPKRDRMGMLLGGPPLAHEKGFNIVSDGTAFGSIQVPGNQTPIVLLADRGTTGGYPKIATVISADLGRLVQMPAGTPFRFKRMTVTEAEAAALEERQDEADHLGTLAPVSLDADLSSERLLSLNLVGGVEDALSGDEPGEEPLP